MATRFKRVLVTGGAGYVGSNLVPKLLKAGYGVTVLDLYLYGRELFADRRSPQLREVAGDLRDPAAVAQALADCDAVIHLACISNDPSFELDPSLGKSINYDCFRPLVRAAKKAGVRRFIYASSSSVYGIKDVPDVDETLSLEPLTDYSKFKAMCEEVLAEEREPGFVTLTLRPATVCGYAPRLRLDLTVNILTNNAINAGKITVFGGSQKRPNINIEDMTDLYVRSLEYPDNLIDGEIFNAGYENHTVMDIAKTVQSVAAPQSPIDVTPTNDLRSYHISSKKIQSHLGFTPRYTIADAVSSIANAIRGGQVPNAMTDPVYYNIKTMQQRNLR